MWKQWSGWGYVEREVSQAPEGPSRWSKEGRRAPPGQIGRIKLFEAAKYRLTGMAYGLMCVSQSETGVYSDSRSTSRLQEEGCGCGGHGLWLPRCWHSWKIWREALKLRKGLCRKADSLIAWGMRDKEINEKREGIKTEESPSSLGPTTFASPGFRGSLPKQLSHQVS